MEDNKCENCKWYWREDSVWGHCHRFPPKEEYKMSYPEVCSDKDFCGEFKLREIAPPAKP